MKALYRRVTPGSLLLAAALVFSVAEQHHARAQRGDQTARGRAADAAPSPQAGHPSGKLVIWGDVSLFERRGTPNNCILTNRFKKGQRVGFRMTAIDGGTGDIENTAVMTVHVTHAGKTVDVPMRWRGAGGAAAPAPPGYLRPPVELWTGFWTVPDDAPTGMVTYTVTASDGFGRTASFKPFPYETSQLAIVE